MGDLIWLSPAQMRRIALCFSARARHPAGRRVADHQRHHLSHPQPGCAGAMRRRRTAFTRRSTIASSTGADSAFSMRSSPGSRPRVERPTNKMIDATHLKAHRTAASMLKKRRFPTYRTHQGRLELKLHAVCDGWGARCSAAQRRPYERIQRRRADARRASVRQGVARRRRGYDTDWLRAGLTQRADSDVAWRSMYDSDAMQLVKEILLSRRIARFQGLGIRRQEADERQTGRRTPPPRSASS
jgi:putative transposase